MLDARNLSYAWGAKPLFSDLSFKVKAGETLVVRGANGSGKSTLLRIIAGLIPSLAPSLSWKEQRLSKQTLSDYQQNISYLGHKLALYTEATLNDQTLLWQNVSRETIYKTLKIWEIDKLLNKKICQLSQGQQKRIALSRLNIFEKALWILDEPHAGLDSEGKFILNECLRNHTDKGGCVIIASHEDHIPLSKEIYL